MLAQLYLHALLHKSAQVNVNPLCVELSVPSLLHTSIELVVDPRNGAQDMSRWVYTRALLHKLAEVGIHPLLPIIC